MEPERALKCSKVKWEFDQGSQVRKKSELEKQYTAKAFYLVI